MWYPNRPQWAAIWIFSTSALALWVFGGSEDGIPGRAATALMFLGALVVWALARRGMSATPKLVSPPQAAALCPSCGNPFSPDQVTCRCGAFLISEADRAKLTGTGGWLALFVFGTLILGPLLVLVFTLTIFEGDKTAGERLRILGPVLLLIGNTVFGVIAGVALLRRRPTAVKLARMYLWTTAIVPVGMALSVGPTLGAEAAGEWFGRQIFTLLGAAIWLKYFSKSRRVAVTFGPDVHTQETSKIFLGFAATAIVAIAMVPVLTLKAFWPSQNATDWVTYAPTGGGFEVQLPAIPNTKTETVQSEGGPLLLHRSIEDAAGDGAAFVLVYLDYPDTLDISAADTVVEGVCDSEISRMNGTKMTTGQSS
jgi:predicted nucleic acid-binding Zn ribbon protein